ncbi:MAG: DUF3309 family protein [Reyranella sp.]|nr:DUF3309 family protein [Reyranella sp.]
MLLLGLALLLTAAGVAAFPCWRYSARWTYGPSATAGVLLFMVGLAATGGRTGTSDSGGERHATTPQTMSKGETSRSTEAARPAAVPPQRMVDSSAETAMD